MNVVEPFAKRALVIGIMVVACAQSGVSILVPALPSIASEFHITITQTQWLVTSFLAAFGLSQLLYGPWSDAIGRRPVFFFGQIMFIAGTLFCLFSSVYEWLIIGRLLQGIGAGSCSVVGRCILSDSYRGHQLIQAMAYFALAASLAPVLSPVLGGWITETWGWHAIFIVVTGYLVVMVGLLYFLFEETLPYDSRPFKLCSVAGRYVEILRDYRMLLPAVYIWTVYLMIVLSITVLPFFLQRELGFSAGRVGELMLIPALGMPVGSIFVGRMRHRMSAYGILLIGAFFLGLAGCWVWLSPLSVFSLIGGFSLVSVAMGLIFPVGTSLLLGPNSHRSGIVTAFCGAIQMVMSASLSGVLIHYWIKTPADLAQLYIFAMALIAGLALKQTQNTRRVKVEKCSADPI